MIMTRTFIYLEAKLYVCTADIHQHSMLSCPHVITWTNVDLTFMRYQALFSIQNIETFVQKINKFMCGIEIQNHINPIDYLRLSFKLGLLLV